MTYLDQEVAHVPLQNEADLLAWKGTWQKQLQEFRGKEFELKFVLKS